MLTKPLLTLAELGSFLNIRPGAQDARLTTLVTLATASLERATGRFFTRQDFVEHLTTRDNQRTDYDFTGSSDFAVPTVEFGGLRTTATAQTMPLQGVSVDPESVTVWYNPYAHGPADYGDSYKLRPGYDFQVNPDNDRLILYIATRFRPRAIRVAYTAGYETITDEDTDEETVNAPDWLKSAVMIQAQFLNIKLRADNIGMAAERTVSEKGKVASSLFLATSGLTPEVIPLVAHLKRVGMGLG